MPEKKGSIFEKDKEKEFIDEPEEFLEGEEHAGTHEDVEVKIHVGDKEADVYTEEGREELTEDEGELAPWEEAYSKGAEGAESGNCAHCNKPLGDRKEVIEKEVKGESVFFCSEKCASSGVAPRK